MDNGATCVEAEELGRVSLGRAIMRVGDSGVLIRLITFEDLVRNLNKRHFDISV